MKTSPFNAMKFFSFLKSPIFILIAIQFIGFGIYYFAFLHDDLFGFDSSDTPQLSRGEDAANSLEANSEPYYPSKTPTDALIAACEAWRMGLTSRGGVIKFAREIYDQFPNKSPLFPTSDDWRWAVKEAKAISDCID